MKKGASRPRKSGHNTPKFFLYNSLQQKRTALRCLSVCLSVCLSNYGGKSHVVNPFFADVSRASRFCASVQTPRKSGLARRCPRPSRRTLRRLATPQSPDNSAPRQMGIVRCNKFTIDPSAIQGFCVNPLYLFRERVKKIWLFSPRTKHFSENLAKKCFWNCSKGREKEKHSGRMLLMVTPMLPLVCRNPIAAAIP